jgi:hypothetical protein
MSEGDVRASDAEREAVAERLRRATAEGRLDPEELDERVGHAYAARTRAQLEALTADLPVAPAPAAPVSPARVPAPGGDVVLPPGRWTAHELRERAAGFVVPNLVCIGVWLATGAHGDFWPRWVLLATIIGLVASFVRGPDAERERRRVQAARRRRR